MKNKQQLRIIFLTVFIDLLGFGILIPILPTFASTRLSMNDFEIGIVVAVYSLIQFLFNPFLGKLSDRYGRRPFIHLNLLITAFAYIMFSFSNSFLLLLLSRIVAGFGGSNIAVAQAYIADITSKEERSKGMGLIGAAFGLGFIFGPIMGGFVSSLKGITIAGYFFDGYHLAGFSAALFSLIAAVYAYFSLPETVTKREHLESGAAGRRSIFNLEYFHQTLKHPTIGLLILIFFIIIFSVSNIYGTFAILGHKVYHFSDKENGYLFGIMGLIGVLIQGGFIRILTEKYSDRSLVIAGVIMMMIGLAGIPYGGNFLGLSLITGLLAVGTGILQPVILSMISKYAPETEQGSILGVNQSLSAFARVLGPLWGGFSYNFLGYQFPFLTGAFFTFLTLLLTIFLLTKERLVEESHHV